MENTMAIRIQGRRGQRGSVLFAALAVVVTIAVLGSCLLQLSAAASREQVQRIDTKRAFYIAEAGLSEAWYGLKVGKSGNVGTADLPASYGDGLLWVEAEDLGGGRTSLVSTGLCGTGRFALSIVVESDSSSVGALGFFADESLSIGEGARVDSYDSTQGPYELLEGPVGGLLGPNVESRVASNGDITVEGSAAVPTLVLGDVQPGPGGTVMIGEGVTIAGSTAPSSKSISMPEIEVPSLTPRGDVLVGARGAISVLPTGESHYGTITVPAGRVLTINGPATVVIDNFNVQAGGKLVINASLGAVALYSTQSLVWSDGSTLDCTHEDPTQLSLQISANQWVDRNGDSVLDAPAVLLAGGDYKGTIYAPESPLEVAADLEVFGAIAAQSLALADGAKLHFDEALAAVVGGPMGDLTVVAWRVMDLPESAVVSLRVDPVQALKLAGVDIPMASKAHEAIMFKIHFMDWTDTECYWKGDESNFMWARVKTLIEVAREGDPNFRTF
jgi:hypothetical protein